MHFVFRASLRHYPMLRLIDASITLYQPWFLLAHENTSLPLYASENARYMTFV
jgi:hypothetical protein